MKRTMEMSAKYKKDLKRIKSRGGDDYDLLDAFTQKLLRGDRLNKRHSHHRLRGKPYDGYQECHVGNDLLLIYEIYEEQGEMVLFLMRAGTHSDLLE